jgi:hypothetical protein
MNKGMKGRVRTALLFSLVYLLDASANAQTLARSVRPMRLIFCFVCVPFILCVTASSRAEFTGKGHLHTLSETRQVFLNQDCRVTGTCDLKRFTLTTSVYEVWFSDDPDYPTYGNGVIMEYETASTGALENYAVVQFKKGCVFYSSQNADGGITRTVGDIVPSFGEDVPFCFTDWVIDSQDADPVYNSDPEYGRFYLLRWNRPGSYDQRTQKYYGAEKPRTPVVYMADYPSGAFVTETSVKNVALQFKSCIYKAAEVPARTRRNDLAFADPIACFDWQNVYVYDFSARTFRTDPAQAPRWPEPSTAADFCVIVVLPLLFIALALVALSAFGIFAAQTSIRRYRAREPA